MADGRYAITTGGQYAVGTSNNDTVAIYGSNVTVESYRGEDSIYFHTGSKNIQVDAGADNDKIDADYANHATINVGNGNDYIYNIAKYAVNSSTGEWEFR